MVIFPLPFDLFREEEEEEEEVDGSAVAAVKDEVKLNMLRFMRCVYVLCAPLVCVTKSDVISKTRKQNEKWIICFFCRSMTRHIQNFPKERSDTQVADEKTSATTG
jgi:hypothetical protein